MFKVDSHNEAVFRVSPARTRPNRPNLFREHPLRPIIGVVHDGDLAV